MKPKTKSKSSKQQDDAVRLEFNHPNAKAVFIAGTFNAWRPEATPMICVSGGRWIKDLALAPGRYEYRFVVDGKWLADPACRDTAPNPFGGLNSVLTIKAAPELRNEAPEYGAIGAAQLVRSTPPRILSANRV